MAENLTGGRPQQVPTNLDLGDSVDYNWEDLPLSIPAAQAIASAPDGVDPYPSVQPSLWMDFENAIAVPNGNIVCTQNDPRPYIDRTGVVRTAGVNEAVIEAVGITEGVGLTSWGPSNNWIGPSTPKEPNVASPWSLTNCTWGTEPMDSPDPTKQVVKLTENATDNNHYVDRTHTRASFTEGDRFTFSVFVKPGGRDRVMLLNYWATNAGGGRRTAFNLADGTYVLGTGTLSAGMQKLASGWWRIWQTVAVDTVPETRILCRILIGGPGMTTGSTGYVGDGVSGIYCWGAQLEQSPFPRAIIPTTEQGLGHANITLTMKPWRDLSLYEGTIYFEFSPILTSTTGGIIRIEGSDFYQSIQLAGGASGTYPPTSFGSVSVNGTYLTEPPESIPQFQRAKYAFSWRGTEYRLAVNGAYKTGPMRLVNGPANLVCLCSESVFGAQPATLYKFGHFAKFMDQAELVYLTS